jgi:hypothetical protein
MTDAAEATLGSQKDATPAMATSLKRLQNETPATRFGFVQGW